MAWWIASVLPPGSRKRSPPDAATQLAVDPRAGSTEEDLLAILGLADDARNRASVQRYLKLAAPPL